MQIEGHCVSRARLRALAAMTDVILVWSAAAT
jgi:hypothetical protein